MPDTTAVSEDTERHAAIQRLRDALAQAQAYPVGTHDWTDAVFLNDLGVALQNAGLMALALQAYDLALGADPGVQLNRASALTALGRHAEAVAACATADPAHPETPARIGETLLKAGDPARALRWLQAAHDRAPDRADVAANLSAGLIALDRLVEAISVLKTTLDRSPGDAALWANLAAALDGLSRFEEAAEALEFAVARDPNNALMRHRLGAQRLKLRQADRAVEACRAAVIIDPNDAAAHIGLGAALRQSGDRQGAVLAYNAALALDPASALAHYNLANVLNELSDGEEAGAAYRAAIALQPDWPSAHHNHGLWLLKQGRYEEGWREYEWRWRRAFARESRREFAAPPWAGQPLQGKTILVHAEQGLGDLIQFVRYVPLVARAGGRVWLEAPLSLHRLFANLDGVAGMLDRGEPPPPCDYHCPYLSLPLGFGTTLDTIPAEIPYLTAEQERVAAWRGALPDGFKVGLVWQGNPNARMDAGRSFRLADLAPLAGAPGVTLVSLQKGAATVQLNAPAPGFKVRALGEPYDQGDFAETAAVLANLDLVIACDTAVAHLAGALGRPIWIATRRDNDWRWLTGRSDSPWYPTARLYRQAERGDWSDVFARMAGDLAALVS